MDKFYKNLGFLVDNPKFIINKLNKMSKVLSSHIHGIRTVEKEVESDSQEDLRKHIHAMMITTAAIAEDVYILNLISMIYLNSKIFSDETLTSVKTILDTVSNEEEHTEVEEKKEETPAKETVSEVVREVPQVESNESKIEEVKEEPVKIQVMESVSNVSEQPVKKKRGRKKKVQS